MCLAAFLCGLMGLSVFILLYRLTTVVLDLLVRWINEDLLGGNRD